MNLFYSVLENCLNSRAGGTPAKIFTKFERLGTIMNIGVVRPKGKRDFARGVGSLNWFFPLNFANFLANYLIRAARKPLLTLHCSKIYDSFYKRKITLVKHLSNKRYYSFNPLFDLFLPCLFEGSTTYCVICTILCDMLSCLYIL